MALGFIVALLFFERLFREWRKLPFTCSYLPAKQTVWMVIFRVFVASGYLLPLASAVAVGFRRGHCLHRALYRLWPPLVALARHTAAEWAESVMFWDELTAASVEALDLGRAKTGDTPALDGIASPARAMFGEQLVASRRILPAAWSRGDRGRPRNRARFAGNLREDVRYGAAAHPPQPVALDCRGRSRLPSASASTPASSPWSTA